MGKVEYQTVFSQVDGQYEVQEIDQAILNVTIPEKQGTVQLHASVIPGFLTVLPVKAQINLEDQAGNPLDAHDVFINPDQSITLSLVEKSTNETIDEAVMLQVSEDNNAVLTGEIGGKIRAHPGEYFAVFDVVGKLNTDQYRVKKGEIRHPFERRDNIFSWPPLWLTLLGLAILAGLLWLVYQINLFRHPIPGEIQFRNKDSGEPFYVLKMGRKGKVHLTNNKISQLSPMLSEVEEININHVSDNPVDGILFEVKLKNVLPKKSILKNGDILGVNQFIDAVYIKEESELNHQINTDEDGLNETI
jgi:hypothetical protein